MTTLPAPDWPGVLARWHVDVLAAAALLAAATAYARGRSRVGGTGRQALAFGSGLAVLAVALFSPVGTYAEALLSAHMVQHLLLVLVAAPLLVASRPLPALLAVLPVAVARRAHTLGRGRLGRTATHPVVAWVVFAATGWAVHFSPLFDLALRHEAVHAAEHALFLSSALLFWTPVLGARPLSHALRLLYVVLAMPQNTFLAVAILSAGNPLYREYERLGRAWGPSVLADQRQAGGVMWVAGDITLLVAVLVLAGAWAAAEAGRDEESPAEPVSEGRAGPPPSPRTAG